jgi:membrane protein
MPTAIPKPPREPAGTAGSVGRLGALFFALGISRFLRRQPSSARPELGRSARRVRPSREGSDTTKPHSGRAAEQKKVTERDRGRTATKPSEIPAKGWKDILWRVYREISDDRVMSVAAGVTFYALLAIFPGIAAFVSLYGLVADPTTINAHLALVSGFLPEGATEIISEQVKNLTSKPAGALGFGFFSGLAVSLWSANAGMKSMFDALNVVYEEDEKRGFIKLNAQALVFTLGALVFLLLALVAVAVIPVVLKLFPFGELVEKLMSILRWPILLVGVLLALAVLYRYGPSRDKAEWRWVTWGSALAALLWIAGSMLFSWYVANFGNYNETYGSLGAAIGFMTWIWLSTIVVLVGAEVNAEMEHQTAQDTTEGADKPIGGRGATVANRVGEAKT